MSTTNSPLHLAVQNGNIDIVKMLLKAGHNPNEVNTEGLTPLHIAVQMGHTEIVQLLAAHIEVGDCVQPNAHGSLVPANAPQNVSLDKINSSSSTNGRKRSVWGLFVILFIFLFFALVVGTLITIVVLDFDKLSLAFLIVLIVLLLPCLRFGMWCYKIFTPFASRQKEEIVDEKIEPNADDKRWGCLYPVIIIMLLYTAGHLPLLAGTILDNFFEPMTPFSSPRFQFGESQPIKLQSNSPSLRHFDRGIVVILNPSIHLINRHGWVKSVLTMVLLVAVPFVLCYCCIDAIWSGARQYSVALSILFVLVIIVIIGAMLVADGYSLPNR